MDVVSAPRVSVLSAVYNVEEYLCRFIDSVINQSCGEWELILVDGGSSDNSGSICDDYAAKDARIKVFHQENRGVSTARNKALALASADWIYFADSDDELLPDCLKILLSGVDDAIDMVCASYERYYNGVFMPEDIKKEGTVFAKRTYLEQITLFRNARWLERYLPTKLLRRSIVNRSNLIFDETLSYREDVLFLITYVVNCQQSIKGIDLPVYRYFRRTTGLAVKNRTRLNVHSFDALFSIAKCLECVGNDPEYETVRVHLRKDLTWAYNHLYVIREKSLYSKRIDRQDFWEEREEIEKTLRRCLPFSEYLLASGKRRVRSCYHGIRRAIIHK